MLYAIHCNISETTVIETHAHSVSTPAPTALELALFPSPPPLPPLPPLPEPDCEGEGPDPDSGAVGNGNGNSDPSEAEPAVSKPLIPDPVGGASVAIASVVRVLWLCCGSMSVRISKVPDMLMFDDGSGPPGAIMLLFLEITGPPSDVVAVKSAAGVDSNTVESMSVPEPNVGGGGDESFMPEARVVGVGVALVPSLLSEELLLFQVSRRHCFMSFVSTS